MPSLKTPRTTADLRARAIQIVGARRARCLSDSGVEAMVFLAETLAAIYGCDASELGEDMARVLAPRVRPRRQPPQPPQVDVVAWRVPMEPMEQEIDDIPF